MARVSCIIRTLNESALLERCISSLRDQQGGHELEFIIVDSGSTDGTLEIAQRHGVTLLHVRKQPLKEFDYSAALNLGIEASRGEFFVSIAAHAIPASNTWLPKMLDHFKDPLVAGADCRQLPWPDAHWTEIVRIKRQFPAETLVFEGDHPYPIRRFSNASSVIRRSCWERVRFTLPAGEDVEWAKRVVRSGFKIVYESSAAVYHSHNESTRDRARRAVNLARSEGDDRGQTQKGLLRQSLGSIARDFRAIRSLEATVSQKLGYALDAMKQGFWYFMESRD